MQEVPPGHCTGLAPGKHQSFIGRAFLRGAKLDAVLCAFDKAV